MRISLLFLFLFLVTPLAANAAYSLDIFPPFQTPRYENSIIDIEGQIDSVSDCFVGSGGGTHVAPYFYVNNSSDIYTVTDHVLLGDYFDWSIITTDLVKDDFSSVTISEDLEVYQINFVITDGQDFVRLCAQPGFRPPPDYYFLWQYTEPPQPPNQIIPPLITEDIVDSVSCETAGTSTTCQYIYSTTTSQYTKFEDTLMFFVVIMSIIFTSQFIFNVLSVFMTQSRKS